MGVIMSKEFRRDLDVDGSMKGKAWDFVMKLGQDADLTGLDVKKPKGAADRRVRTARVDDNFRAVLFAVGDEHEPMWLLAAIKKHDDAYRHAETLTLTVNPANGAMEVLATQAVRDRVDDFRKRPVADDTPCVLPYPVADLVALGLDADVSAEAVRQTDQDAVMELTGDLPEWQQRALLDLVTGTPLDEVRAIYAPDGPVVDDDPRAAVARPTSRMQFVYLDTDEELRRAMEGDFAAWRTYLHPTQRAVAHRPTYNGPFRLAGGAGTGKTVVAVHRAAFLARRRGARILLCTFTRNLAAHLEVDLRSLVSPEEAARVDVRGVDQVVRAVGAAADGAPGAVLGDREQESLWEEAVRAAGVPAELVPQLTAGFLAGEYRTVVLGMDEHSRAEYLRVKRSGRGVRLNRVQRAAVWNVVEAFERGAQAQGRTSYDLLTARAGKILADPSAQGVRYDHVIVDEGQDLHAGHWRVLRGLVAPGPNDLFVCEDGHQRIYGDRIVLSRLGIETRGRSRRLTLNYRTSRQNLAFALGVIGGEPVVDLDGDEETVKGYRSTFRGPVPVTRGFPGVVEEMRFVAETVAGWIGTGVEPASIGVLARRAAEQDRARLALQDAGVPVEVLAREGAGNAKAVKIASMHRAKGTEFSHVIVVGAEAGVVPLDWVVETQPAADHAAVRGRERSLFYVACSRARDELVVTWAGTPSPFIPESSPAAGAA